MMECLLIDVPSTSRVHTQCLIKDNITCHLKNIRDIRGIMDIGIIMRGNLRLMIGDLRLTIGDRRLTIGDLRLTIGDRRLTIGDLRLTIGDLRLTIGDLRLTIGDLRLTIGDLRLTIGDRLRIMTEILAMRLPISLLHHNIIEQLHTHLHPLLVMLITETIFISTQDKMDMLTEDPLVPRHVIRTIVVDTLLILLKAQTAFDAIQRKQG
jgi:hypothetical protein